MKKQLSAWKYIKNNKRPAAAFVTALSLAFMAMYTVYVLLITTPESFRTLMLEMPKRISYAKLTYKAYGLSGDQYESKEALIEAFDQKQDELIQKLKDIPGIEDAFCTQVINHGFRAVIGSCSFYVPLMEAEQLPGFLNHMGAELVQGEMPKEPGEMLVDDTIMKNSCYQIGDWFRKDGFGETFRITGTIRSDYKVSAGIPNGFANKDWYIVIYNDEQTMDLTSILQDMGIVSGDEDDIVDINACRKEYCESVEELIDMAISTIFAIVMVFLAIMVIAVYVSFLRNRVNEYCLYASLGYSRVEVYGMALREMSILFGMALATGLLISFGAAYGINRLIIRPYGLVGHVFYGKEILIILGMYLFLIGVLQIPILFSLKRIRTIDAIEE